MCIRDRVQSLELTNRSDIYSLGAVMYELLTGTRPFRAGNLAKLLHQIVYATPPPIHVARPDVPEDLENVVAVAMQKDPERRQKSGLDLAAELTRVHQKLRQQNSRMDQQEQFGCLLYTSGTAIAIVEKRQVDVGPTLGLRLECQRHLVGGGQPMDEAHRQPIRNGGCCGRPETLERTLDIQGHLSTHP